MRKLSDLLVLDLWTDAAMTVTWLLFGSWALLYTISAATRTQSLVSDAIGYVSALVWASILAAACLACAGFGLVVLSTANSSKRLHAAKLERSISLVAIFFALAYTLWELARLLTDPTWDHALSLPLAIYYPLWPWWCFHELKRRTAAIATTVVR